MRKALFAILAMVATVCFIAAPVSAREIEFNATGGKAKVKGSNIPFAISTCAPVYKSVSITSATALVNIYNVQPKDSYGTRFTTNNALSAITATYSPDKPGMHNQFWATDQIMYVELKSGVAVYNGAGVAMTSKQLYIQRGTILEVENAGVNNVCYVKPISGTLTLRDYNYSGY